MTRKRKKKARTHGPAPLDYNRPLLLYYFDKKPPHVLRKQPKNFSKYLMRKYQPHTELELLESDGRLRNEVLSPKRFRRFLEYHYSGLPDAWYIWLGRSQKCHWSPANQRFYRRPVGAYKFKMRDGYIVEEKTSSHGNRYRKNGWTYYHKGLRQHRFALPQLWVDRRRRIETQKAILKGEPPKKQEKKRSRRRPFFAIKRGRHRPRSYSLR